jgi:hypothetical protein
MRREETMRKKNRSLALKPKVLPPVGNVLDKRDVEAYVENKIVEILNGPAAIFEPWFRSIQISREIRRHQTALEGLKWPYYFEKWGCLVCETKDRLHWALGMDEKCNRRIYMRLKESLRRAAIKKGGNALAVSDLGTLARELPDVRRMLSSFVEIAEILNGQDPVFEPFFQTQAIANEIRKHQTALEVGKWTYFYDEWGCLVCSTANRWHQSVGMCARCYMRTTARLKECLRCAVHDKAASGPIVLPRDLGDLARKSLLEAVRSGKVGASLKAAQRKRFLLPDGGGVEAMQNETKYAGKNKPAAVRAGSW